MAVIPLEGTTLPKLNLSTISAGLAKKNMPENERPEYIEFVLSSDSTVEVNWQ